MQNVFTTLKKIPLYLADIDHSLEKRKQGETKIITLTVQLAPFDAKLASAFDADQILRRALFKLNTPDAVQHFKSAEFRIAFPRQRLHIFATTDSPKAGLLIDHVRVASIRVRIEKKSTAFVLLLKLAFGPAGKTELEFVEQWRTNTKAVTFEEAEPSMDFEDDDHDEDEDASRPPAPMFDDPREAMGSTSTSLGLSLRRQREGHRGLGQTAARRSEGDRARGLETEGHEREEIGGVRLTPRDRAAAYAAAFPTFPPLRADDRWLDGVWIMGSFYKGNGFYGCYPPNFLKRIATLFPETWTRRGLQPDVQLLHLFSGSLSTREPGLRVDLHPDRRPTVQASALALPFRPQSIDLTMADPPYNPRDAERYGTPMPNRLRVLREVARVTKPGGQLVWVDEVLPVFAKQVWHWWGVIGMTCGTNRRGRFVFMFERTRTAV